MKALPLPVVLTFTDAMDDDDDYGAPAKKPKQGILASAAALPKGGKVSDLLYSAEGQQNPHTGAL